MGLPKNTLDFIVSNAGDLSGKQMLELGNQRIRGNADTKCKTGKEFFTEAGCKHVSIDMNGLDGAFKKDLNKPIYGLGKFNVITNSGTSGYVANQIQCFKNIHSLCKDGGRMIHIVPEKDSKWTGKQYDAAFFVRLADEYGYDIVTNETMEGQYGLLRCVVLVKARNDKRDI